MFQIVLSGPTITARDLIAALTNEGFPSQLDEQHGGFPAEEDVSFIESVASSADYLNPALGIAARYGYTLRMHSWIDAPTIDEGTN